LIFLVYIFAAEGIDVSPTTINLLSNPSWKLPNSVKLLRG